jgi:hypothetical protein
MIDKAKELPIDNEFVRWYRAVNLDDNRERVRQRYDAMVDLIEKADFELVEAALRIVFQTKQKAKTESVATIESFFKQYDELFDAVDKSNEFQLLCATMLGLLLNKDNSSAAVTALSVLTTAFGGTRKLQGSVNLEELSNKTVERLAEKFRQRPPLSTGSLSIQKLNLTASKAKLSEDFTANGIGLALDVAADTMRASINATLVQLSNSVAAIQNYVRVQDEELELLWWAYGQRSEYLNKSFADIPDQQRILLLPTEMAMATKLIPGPVSAKALLMRSGIGQKRVRVVDAINECEMSWLERLDIPDGISPVRYPIHCGLWRRIETGDDTSWISGWSGVTGIDENLALPGITLAMLFYFERLILEEQ